MGAVAIFLTIAGTIFCIIEFFTPGLGVFAIGGVVSLIVSYFLLLDAFLLDGFYAFALQVVIFTIVGIISYFALKKSNFVSKIVLEDVTRDTVTKVEESIIGKSGVCKTPLKPVGTITVEGHDIEALSNDGYLNIGDAVIVSDIVKNKVFVKKI